MALRPSMSWKLLALAKLAAVNTKPSNAAAVDIGFPRLKSTCDSSHEGLRFSRQLVIRWKDEIVPVLSKLGLLFCATPWESKVRPSISVAAPYPCIARYWPRAPK